MNAVVVRGMGQSNAVAVLRPRGIAFILLWLCGSSAFALDGELSSTLAGASASSMSSDRARPQLAVSASSLPRFDNTDGSSRTSRLDMAFLPPQRSALGPSLGMTGLTEFTPSPFGLPPGTSPSLDLGLHWRYTPESSNRIDVTAWRRLQQPDALTLVQGNEPSYGARVEMQLGSASKSGFVADRGFLGLQLESGARVTLKRSHGKPMVYYRRKF